MNFCVGISSWCSNHMRDQRSKHGLKATGAITTRGVVITSWGKKIEVLGGGAGAAQGSWCVQALGDRFCFLTTRMWHYFQALKSHFSQSQWASSGEDGSDEGMCTAFSSLFEDYKRLTLFWGTALLKTSAKRKSRQCSTQGCHEKTYYTKCVTSLRKCEARS